MFVSRPSNGEARQETTSGDKGLLQQRKMGSTGQNGESRGRRLDSWKAIAQYLDRDVRSVQRWEHERGLPVYRLPGQKSSAVFAYEAELENWLRSRGNDSPLAEASHAPAAASRWPLRRSFVWGTGAVVVIVLAGAAFLHWKPAPPASVAPSEPRTIAVLPMQNLSGDAAQDYFADGFTEELVTELAEVRSFRVISRTSTMVYKGSRKPLPLIARELHAKYVVEGSVARFGAHVRVIAQLIDAASDTHISARTYDTDVKDVLDVQGRISRAIADDVRLDLSPEERARLASVHQIDPAAHDLYLRAGYAFRQQTANSIRQSLALYQAATARAPGFARAYLGIALAEAALLQITAESPAESVLHEREALAKALAIDPHLGDAHGLLASLVYYYDWDWPRAEREFRLAATEGAQAPTEQRYGFAIITRGRFKEGLAHLETALKLDPLGKSPRVNQIIALMLQRRGADARRELNEMLASSPDFLAGHVLLASLTAQQGDCARTGVESNWVALHYPSPMADVALAMASACHGDIAAARTNLEHAVGSKSPKFASAYQIALGYASIHDKEAVLSYLKKSADLHEPQILYIGVEPLFDLVRSDPRFAALERRLGLTG
ncbi:MAG TPA: hypothetical protein VGF97_03210 [Rhizomicrobium sp.]